MMRIIEHTVDLDFPAGRGVHTLVAQIPNRLRLEGRLFKIANKKEQNARIMSILEVAGRLSKALTSADTPPAKSLARDSRSAAVSSR